MGAVIQDYLNVVQQAAISCYDFINQGQEKDADNAAVSTMRNELNRLPIRGEVVIGEGERDNAPMLHIGEKVGAGWKRRDEGDSSSNNDENHSNVTPNVSIALDPLEGTTLCANGVDGALSVMAVSQHGCLLKAPDIYMNKIVVGAEFADCVDIDKPIADNIKGIAKKKGVDHCNVTVVMLDRERHRELIQQTKDAGANVRLIQDGDVLASIEIVMAATAAAPHAAAAATAAAADMYVGIGGAPEGVLAAAAVGILGGFMQGRLLCATEDDEKRCEEYGISDINKKYSANELASGNGLIFIATAITNNSILTGVKKVDLGQGYCHNDSGDENHADTDSIGIRQTKYRFQTHSLVMSYGDQLIQYISQIHL